MPSTSGSDQFAGTARFAIRRRLGAGGSGVVYEAFDRERKAVVALKTLRRTDPESLYRFKQEFRALADLSHPNLIALYELLSEGDQWFFTMEMIEGTNFLEHVRGPLPGGDQDSWREMPTPTVSPDEVLADGGEWRDPAPPIALTPGSVGRLRAALRQLAEGLCALHEANKLHRDIKPSNVLVSGTGRVVLLDFGLVGELGARGVSGSGANQVMGTPSYMSPEQSLGAPLTAASDWCSVGVMLYVALTGMRPFPRRGFDEPAPPARFEPRRAREIVPEIPGDLGELCMSLLRTDPRLRPSGREVIALLDGAQHVSASPWSEGAAPPLREAPFVGRARELADLEAALRTSKEGRAAIVYVQGPSGVGKSALVHHFLQGLQQRERVVVLEGRCYERESVPYKALDSLVDGLSLHLKRLPAAEAEALLPRDFLALARLFPVLRRVEAVAGARRRGAEIPDRQQMRRRAFAALRELFGRLADRVPLVLFIDDVHWGDADSAALLAELLRGPEAPALLLVVSYHSEDAAIGSRLRGLLEASVAGAAAEVWHLRVDPLDEIEASALAYHLLGGAAGQAHAEALARESAGNPFLLRELARYTVSMPEESAGSAAGVTLETILAARLASLPSDARRLLDAIAVAGQPVRVDVAVRAAVLDSGELEPLRTLVAAHLVRARGTHEHGQVETYHDRMREAVLARLRAEDASALHRRLAVSLEAAGDSGPETLAVHFAAGGDSERAAEHAAAAAQQAGGALAFDRAARLYRWTLELHAPAPAEARRLRVSLGEALANAGRGAEAAEAYLAAAEGAAAAEQIDLRRRAAEQRLISGHFDEGIDLLRTVLRSIGMKLAETPARAVLSLLLRRARIRLRGLDFTEHDATQVSAEALIRIDTCWSAAIGLSFSDTIRGADFQARHLLLALDAGEPYRVARALAMEVGYRAIAGGSRRARTDRLIARATELAERVGHPHALALLTFTTAVAAFSVGDWPRARVLGEEAEHLLRERCTGVTWELDNVQLITLLSLATMGELREFTGRLSSLLREAEDRGDLYVATSLRTRVAYMAELAADRPEQAREAVRDGMRAWSRGGFHLQHVWELFGYVEISLYMGDGLDAWARMSEAWPLLARSHQLQMQNTRIWSYFHRGHCALAAMACGGPTTLRDAAARDARRVERERTHWGDALAELLRAGLALAADRRPEALACLARAEAGLGAAHMALYATAARRHRGAALGGPEGQALIADADARMRAETIQNPARMAAKLAPGGPLVTAEDAARAARTGAR